MEKARGNRHREALTGFPCHTTVHTGPYTAVQFGSILIDPPIVEVQER